MAETMTVPEPAQADARRLRLRRANRRTALVLAVVAIVFFAGVIASRLVDSPLAGIAALGVAVLAFLGIAIGRNLRDR